MLLEWQLNNAAKNLYCRGQFVIGRLNQNVLRSPNYKELISKYKQIPFDDKVQVLMF